MIVHDTRVTGNIRASSTSAPNIYAVNGSTSVQHIFNWVASYAGSHGGLSDLFILAHGLGGRNVYDSGRGMSYTASGGGGEVLIGREGLHIGNVALTNILNGQVTKITLVSCLIANNSDERIRGTQFDGWQLCRELAGHSGAEVVASSATQLYLQDDNSIVNRIFGMANQIHWSSVEDMEPPVYSFPADGSEPRRLR